MNRDMPQFRHYFKDIPGLGNVAVTRHAQAKMIEDGISPEEFAETLLSPTRPDVFEAGVRWRERAGVRLIIVERPEPWRGAKLVTTAFRIQRQAKAK